MSYNNDLVLKEEIYTEVTGKTSDAYVKKLSHTFSVKLNKVAKIIVSLYKKDISPTDAVRVIKVIFNRYPQLNPIKDMDSIGVKMYMQALIDDKKTAGDAKRYYESIIDAFIREKM